MNKYGLVRPEKNEYFWSTEGFLCVMEEDAYYREWRGEEWGWGFRLMYLDTGIKFTKLRDVTLEELNTRLIERRGKYNMNTAYEVTLEDGHDTKKGLQHLEATYIEHVYKLARYNQSRAAINLGISRGCLRMKLKQFFGDQYL